MFNYNIKGYIFLQNLDSYGGDFKYFKIENNFDEIVKICDNDENILGFNTLGYIKKELNEFDELIFLENNENSNIPRISGLFVKNSFYEKNYRNFFNKIDNNRVLCLNLERRNDRKQEMIKEFKNNIVKYEFYNAIDGLILNKSFQLLNLFEGNDFFYRKGVIGCALSHINIWKELIEDNINENYLILEDDIKFCDDFETKYLNILKKANNYKWDIIYFGYHKKIKNILVFEESNLRTLNKNEFYGGTFGYLINKNGAKLILSHINKYGCKRAIDMVMIENSNLKIFECYPQLIYSEWVDSSNSRVDSDIQKDFNVL